MLDLFHYVTKNIFFLVVSTNHILKATDALKKNALLLLQSWSRLLTMQIPYMLTWGALF
jgi:hypothetical protein